MRTFASFVCAALLLLAVTTKAQRVIKAKLTDDIAYLVQTVEAIHLNAYHNISKERFYKLRDSIIRWLPDSASTIDARESMALLLASLKEGHSDLRYLPQLAMQLDNGDLRLFPLFAGKPANDYGELYSGVLPNTKIRFVTSTKMFVRANGNAADTNPVLPYLTVTQNPMSEKDDVLEFAVKWVKEK